MGSRRATVPHEPVGVHNPDGRSPFLLVCDHASNYVPFEYGTFGLEASQLTRHIAWDPGALPVSLALADAIDATVVHSCISRLVVDCNRPLNAPDLIWETSETTRIPGNLKLNKEQRQRRIDLAYTPFHATIDKTICDRLARGQETWVVSIHSFTPVYKGVRRPWHIGIIHDFDERLAAPMIGALRKLDSVNVGVNQPYAPSDRVYFTLEKHARSRRLPCAMIEIRNDEIGDEAGQTKWAKRLEGVFQALKPDASKPVDGTGEAEGPANNQRVGDKHV